MEIDLILKQLSNENSGVILTKAAGAQGVSRAKLSHLAKTGKLIRIANGQYIFSSELEDELKTLSNRSQQIVFSHETALFLNGISERTPFVHSVTISSAQSVSKSFAQQCKLYYVKPALHEVGKTILYTTLGAPVPCYDMERTICDIIRSRNRIADETFLASLKLYAASPQKNLSNLQKYAAKFGITKAVRHYMEVLL